MTEAELLLDKLDELIKVTREASLGDRCINARRVADVLDYSYPYTLNRIVQLPDFPDPVRVIDDTSEPRWLKSDVLAWARSRKRRRAA